MTSPVPIAAKAAVSSGTIGKSHSPPVPAYLESVYWWAYVHPNAVNVFEREWLVNAILFGNYARLRDHALDALGQTIQGRTLQIACVYGNLTPKLLGRMAPDGEKKLNDEVEDMEAEFAARMEKLRSKFVSH